MLYTDPAGEVDNALRQNGPPTVEVRDQYDVVHRLWKVSDPAVIQTVQAKMADKKLIIADGHHRYETALTYRNEMRKQANPDLRAPFERVMMTFVNMDAPGLVVLPTHRVVFGMEGFAIFDMVAKLQENFEVEDLGPLTDAAAALDRLACRPAKTPPLCLRLPRMAAFCCERAPSSTRRSSPVCRSASVPSMSCNCISWCWKTHWECQKMTFAIRST